MNTKQFRCRHCRKLRPIKVIGQKYCGQKKCQQARKRRWGKEKYACDPDYRANQRASTHAWLESKGGTAAYYREYRRLLKRQESGLPRTTPGAKDKERVDQGNTRSSLASLRKELNKSANRDAILEKSCFKPGRYVICPVSAKEDANRDAFLVKIDLISAI